jgi:hypothetical protein
MFDCFVVQLTISGIAHPGPAWLGSLYGYRISARKTIIPVTGKQILVHAGPLHQIP